MLRGLTPRSPSRARSATPSCPAICPSSNAGANYPIPSASATSRRIAVAAMSNSTWSSTAARLALRLAAGSGHPRSRARRLPDAAGLGLKRIGLLGGSFDPVHVAHLALSKNALQNLGLAAVELIPAANPWQRAALHATGQQRCAMLDLAIAGHDGLVVNPIEIERGGATYTIDTLRALPQDARYVWLLGADQLANFCTWRNWRDIASLVDLAVATRPGPPLPPPAELAAWRGEQGHSLE
ncbi:hypothetical protein G6F24_014752 [Rhizopus arrhizus]|nr:hypothetical protein G6F24_014752 [Rhizopus arrhizus]